MPFEDVGIAVGVSQLAAEPGIVPDADARPRIVDDIVVVEASVSVAALAEVCVHLQG